MDQTFVLYRILGNDLPPRHGSRQTLDNLRFLLDNEPPLPGCEKRWLVNRIADPQREAEVLALLNERGQKYRHIPFRLDEYASLVLDADGLPSAFNSIEIAAGKVPGGPGIHAHDWMFRHKNVYITNVNGARNATIEDGIESGANWIMPWDGSCFLTTSAFNEIRQTAAKYPDARYLIVPMMRLSDNRQLLDPMLTPNPVEEPQVILRRDARDRFDDTMRYGNMNKAEFLLRIGVPGPWEKWPFTAWEPRRFPVAADQGKYVPAGWVARLSSQAAAEIDAGGRPRRLSRFGSIAIICASLDARVVRRAAPTLICYPPLMTQAIGGPGGSIAQAATRFLSTPRLSVTDKQQLPSGATRNDYVSVERYRHEQIDGRQVVRDGEQNREAVRGTPESDAFDRYRLEDMIEAVTSLALAAHFDGNAEFGAHAATLVRAWFLNPETRMNPHMRFAQIPLSGPNEGSGRGVVDFRDFWALCDALRLLARSGAITAPEETQLKAWFRAFLADVARYGGLVSANNNIGVWHDVLFATLAAYSDETNALAAVLSRASLRIHRQTQPWGPQPAELTRAMPLHYSLFGLQAMISLAWIGRHSGIDLWKYAGAYHRSIPMALRFIALNRTLFTDYASNPESFDDRIEAAIRCIPEDAADRSVLEGIARRALSDPLAVTSDDGFPPLWGLFLAAEDEKPRQGSDFAAPALNEA